MKKPKKRGGYVQLPRAILYTPNLTTTEKAVWSMISDIVDAQEYTSGSRIAVISIADIAKKLGISRVTAKKAVDQLDRQLLIERRKTDIPGYADAYTVPSQDVIEMLVAQLDTNGREKY